MIALAATLFLAVQAPAEDTSPQVPLEPLVGAKYRAGNLETPAPAATASQTAEPFQPIALGLDLGLDVLSGPYVPMASTRLDVRYELPAGPFVAGAGLRSGYSYAFGKGAVADPRLGADPGAFLMMHRIPVQGLLSMGLQAKSPLLDMALRPSIYGAGGASVVFGQSHSFGRNRDVLALAPTLTLGGRIDVEPSPALRVGLFGEWDGTAIPAETLTPGLDPNLSVFRVGLAGAFAFGA